MCVMWYHDGAKGTNTTTSYRLFSNNKANVKNVNKIYNYSVLNFWYITFFIHFWSNKLIFVVVGSWYHSMSIVLINEKLFVHRRYQHRRRRHTLPNGGHILLLCQGSDLSDKVSQSTVHIGHCTLFLWQGIVLLADCAWQHSIVHLCEGEESSQLDTARNFQLLEFN